MLTIDFPTQLTIQSTCQMCTHEHGPFAGSLHSSIYAAQHNFRMKFALIKEEEEGNL